MKHCKRLTRELPMKAADTTTDLQTKWLNKLGLGDIATLLAAAGTSSTDLLGTILGSTSDE